MTEKDKKPDLEKEVKPKEWKPRLFTTNDPISPKKKAKMIQTRDLPSFLPGFHRAEDFKPDEPEENND